MARLKVVRLIMLFASSVLCALPLFAGGAPDQQAYVVTVRPDASVDGIRTIAREMAASYGGTVVEGIARDEDTFVIRVPQSRARVLAVDPRVKSVAPMRLTPSPQAVVETVPWSSGVSYSYDGTGNVTQIGSDAFVYDGVSRLTQAAVNSVHRSYQYDAFGNRTACTQIGTNDCQGFLINAAENKNRISGAGYDAAGNVTGLSGHVYSYDPMDMMTRDTWGQLAREFVYTSDDERIATYTVGYSWSWTIRGSDGKVLREFTSNDGPAGPGTSSWQWTQDHVWRNGQLLASRQPEGANTTTYHYHLDHLDTPRRITDQNDRIVGVHDYLAYGPELSGATAEPSATALKYTGHERDIWSGSSDALDYMHARYYSPWMGRFLSVDSHLGTSEAPQSWNRYAYTMSNPLKAIDPDGNATFLVVYGNGAVNPQSRGQDHDQGDQFQVAAQTRANEIRSSGVLENGDDVFVMSASNVDEFAAVTNHQYATGKIASMDVFSHSWADPSPGNDPGPGLRGGLNLGGEGERGVRPDNLTRIDKTNFSAGATITLWGCNAGKTPALGGPSFAQSMANALGASVSAHTGPAEFNKGGKGHPPMVPSNPVRGKMTVFNPQNKNLLRVQP